MKVSGGEGADGSLAHQTHFLLGEEKQTEEIIELIIPILFHFLKFFLALDGL